LTTMPIAPDFEPQVRKSYLYLQIHSQIRRETRQGEKSEGFQKVLYLKLKVNKCDKIGLKFIVTLHLLPLWNKS